MGFSRAIVVAVAAILLIQFSPSLLDFEPKYHDIPLPNFEGQYAQNDLLSKSKRLHEDVLLGPEAPTLGPDGHIYAGIANGYIVRIVGEKVENVARTGTKDCAKEAGKPHECGRPLGLRFGKDGLLYVADAFYGILSVNVASGKVTQLVSIPEEVDGKNITFPDDLDITRNGVIYFSDASTKWDLYKVMYVIMERQTDGRVLKYDPKSKKVEVAVDGISFANGVQLAEDENSLLVCECGLRRILRYYLNGPKKGQREVFVDQLPGYPDNIRPSSSGGYWVGLAAARSNTNKLTIDILMEYPVILRLFARTQYLVGSITNFIGNLFSCQCLKDWGLLIQTGMFHLSNSHSMAIELSKEGKVLRSLIAPGEHCGHISHVIEHKGSLYFGSFGNNYLGVLKEK